MECVSNDISNYFNSIIPDDKKIFFYRHYSKSQLMQDIFVLSELNFKRDGYFIEFGAADGVYLSNTHLLEKEFGWKGILAEPARCFHTHLLSKRSCNIELDCVWDKSNEKLLFNEVTNFKEGSTIDTFSDCDHLKESRTGGVKYEVNTISFNDLLQKYNAPSSIDYLSIDTEGSELDILKSLDYDKYKIKIITCEHNNTDKRQIIYDFLISKNYSRKLENISWFDDWYVLNN